MQQTHHLHVNTDLQELSRILEWLQSLDQFSVSEEDWMQCQIALAEGFTNVVRHAHKTLSPETSIDIDLDFFPAHVEMRIWDYGPPFSLMEQLESLSASVDDELGSGRGLILLQKIADQLEYVRVDAHRNCLMLIKHRSSEH
ncbi:MAG: ATP-binding protein [Thermosynechococcaceae cyanobacterium]